MFRRALFVLAVLGLLGVGAAAIAWLGWHSDAELARWSSIAGVISAVLSALAVVLALVPILQGKGGEAGRADHDKEAAQVASPQVNVTQKVKHNRGSIQGEGIQVNRFGGQKP